VQLGRGGSVVTSKTALWLSGAAALVFAPALADEPETIGTGFFANQEGLAVTNAHVVNECRRTTARFRSEIVEARVIAQDTQIDTTRRTARVIGEKTDALRGTAHSTPQAPILRQTARAQAARCLPPPASKEEEYICYSPKVIAEKKKMTG